MELKINSHRRTFDLTIECKNQIQTNYSGNYEFDTQFLEEVLLSRKNLREQNPFEDNESDSVKRHLSRRRHSVLNLKFDFISDGGCTREEQIALSLKRHLFRHGGRELKAFGFVFDAAPHLEDFFQFLELSTKVAFAKAAFDTR